MQPLETLPDHLRRRAVFSNHLDRATKSDHLTDLLGSGARQLASKDAPEAPTNDRHRRFRLRIHAFKQRTEAFEDLGRRPKVAPKTPAVRVVAEVAE